MNGMNGNEFVEDLYNVYGLLEGYRLCKAYLELQKNATDPEEIKFCDEVRSAMQKLDLI